MAGSVGPGRDRAELNRTRKPILEAPERLDRVYRLDSTCFEVKVIAFQAIVQARTGKQPPRRTKIAALMRFLVLDVAVISGLEGAGPYPLCTRAIPFVSPIVSIPRSTAPSPHPLASAAGPAASRNSTAGRNGHGRRGREAPRQIQIRLAVFGQEGNGDRGNRLAHAEGGELRLGASRSPADQDPIIRSSRLALQRHRLAGAKQVDLDEVGPSTRKSSSFS